MSHSLRAEGSWRGKPPFYRRGRHAIEHAPEESIDEWAFAELAREARLMDGWFHAVEHLLGGDVEMVEALGHGPGPGRGLPVELCIGNAVKETGSLFFDGLHLVEQTFDFRVQDLGLGASGNWHG